MLSERRSTTALPRDSLDDLCFLCQTHDGEISDDHWFDRPIYSEPGVGVAVPAVGSFVPGYLLVAPWNHVRSVANVRLEDEEFFAFFERIWDQLHQRLGGPFTTFEHGSCSTEAPSSACIEHAHIHIVPGSFRLAAHKQIASYNSLSDFWRSDELRARSYVMSLDDRGRVSIWEDPKVSQFFRRQIALHLDLEHEWDYALAPRYEVMRLTYDLLGVK